MFYIFLIGFIFISIVGTLLHFTYELSNHNKYVALFSAVNESTWEHIKIALTPYFVWSLVDLYLYGNLNNYFFAKLVGVLSIVIIIPIIFYTYQIFTKKPILFIDIITFYVAIFLGQYFSYLSLNMNDVPHFINYLSIILLTIIFGIYITATIMPIKNFLFKDPLTNKYGIKGHAHHEHKN
ncbi:MAG: DUF6512 family protein [bacterium]|nr:DUF6512 family protein [bacterium]